MAFSKKSKPRRNPAKDVLKRFIWTDFNVHWKKLTKAPHIVEPRNELLQNTCPKWCARRNECEKFILTMFYSKMIPGWESNSSDHQFLWLWLFRRGKARRRAILFSTSTITQKVLRPFFRFRRRNLQQVIYANHIGRKADLEKFGGNGVDLKGKGDRSLWRKLSGFRPNMLKQQGAALIHYTDRKTLFS